MSTFIQPILQDSDSPPATTQFGAHSRQYAADARIAGDEPPPPNGMASLEIARQRMIATGQWNPGQIMGRRWPVGCVALEITQRCNLDCTACYLSEHSESVRDIPVEEVFRRIDAIFDRFGPHTDVQVTGGDPTLRKREELVAIVRRIRQRGMRPSLFTNGIKASRNLLEELVTAGLVDVAFHVDLTQKRRRYRTEADLNVVRLAYIDRVRGLPLSVLFNTTVTDGNFDQIPGVVAFFVQHSDVVRLASFQLQAATGRGTLGQRHDAITTASLVQQIELGTKTRIAFDALSAGHSRCNRYAMTLVANGQVYDLLNDKTLVAEFLARTSRIQFDRQDWRRAMGAVLSYLLRNPDLVIKGAGWFGRKVWAMKRDLVVARGRVNKLSFFVHNFMDACHLEPDRLDACVFMVESHDGPVSMCLHNAHRDAFILDPLRMPRADGDWFWDPITGNLTRQSSSHSSREAAFRSIPACGAGTPPIRSGIKPSESYVQKLVTA